MIVESEIVGLISNLGFPIALCLWFMFRTEKIIKANTSALREFSAACERLNK